MQTIKSIDELKNLVETRAKYQKVMLLFDNSATTEEINRVHEQIAGECVYNQQNIELINEQELQNGYKMLILLMSSKSLLSIKFDLSEFISVFYQTDSAILPFFLTNSRKRNMENSYILASQNCLDMPLISSLAFLKAYREIDSFFSGEIDNGKTTFNLDCGNSVEYINTLNNLKDFTLFVDIEIIEKAGIDYENLPVVDLILTNAFLSLVLSAESRTIGLADIYKEAGENYALIDKFYALANNNFLLDIISLNYDTFLQTLLETKSKIMSTIRSNHLDLNLVADITEKIKDYSKNCDNLLAFLYLYDVFKVSFD